MGLVAISGATSGKLKADVPVRQRSSTSQRQRHHSVVFRKVLCKVL